ncbi:hypothetical protein [Parasulfitobacter algicola]|uniref:Uncharacterized protein n=1 Tax=Parasulfitobacter algicola TaxID=2614809 RepID=A0ABX2IRZ4_9RHOB|nr:hypothetical protein [Sulfitobacter algicola]NSX55305.1 hypothetical protein [Sulfitobacter algicola]
MSDEFIFVPNGEILTENGVVVEYEWVESPELIANYLMADEMLAAWFQDFLINPEEAEAKPTPVPVRDMPVLVANVDVWAETFELLGWCGNDGLPVPFTPDDWRNPEEPDDCGGPFFTDIGTFEEMGFL